jgi:hypothetical protein
VVSVDSLAGNSSLDAVPHPLFICYVVFRNFQAGAVALLPKGNDGVGLIAKIRYRA